MVGNGEIMVGKNVKIGKIPCPQFGLAISPKIPLFVQWMIYGGTTKFHKPHNGTFNGTEFKVNRFVGIYDDFKFSRCASRDESKLEPAI